MTVKNIGISCTTRRQHKYPLIESEALTGHGRITGTELRLTDYWSWAHSALIDNTERAAFAEFLVHTAMNESDTVRQSWKSYDVLSPEGIKIEVKASGYIQVWPQEKLSSVSFSIRPAHSWDMETSTYADELTRDSDVYVFCFHNHIEQESLNILDLSQWKFFVLLTRSIEAGVGMQKIITLNRIKSLGAIETDYDNLRDTIINAIRRHI